jgi:phosphoglycerol transferase MdoB-like AlkP superfamily enzyme
MGFDAYALSAGFDRCLSKEDYEKVHGHNDFDGYWGIWDDRFLDFVGEELSQFSEPFFASVFTLSSHHPFVVPERFKDQLPKGHTPIQPCAAYEDMSFELFFEKYGNEEWLKRTIFVFVADHVSSERYSEEAKVWPGIHHIISFVYAPDSELKGCYEGITQQIDIMPTVLNMVGVDEPFFAFGRDILNENKKPEWSVSYENGYQVMTPQGALVIPEESIPDDETGRALKAFIQQYYKHISEKSYVVR